jgi:hypothetical protein
MLRDRESSNFVPKPVGTGARHVTLPLAVIEKPGDDPRSDEAIRMFSEYAGR